jgi:hypothetical protein
MDIHCRGKDLVKGAGVDEKRFDHLSRIVGDQTDRRHMFKAVAGSALAAVGLAGLARTALGEDVTTESRGYKGDSCFDSTDCRTGLVCNQRRGKCQYRKACGGLKKDACKKDGDCCKNQNLVCTNHRCKRNKRRR